MMSCRNAFLVLAMVSLLTTGAQALGDETTDPESITDPSLRPPLVDPKVGRLYRKKLFDGEFGLPKPDEVAKIEVDLLLPKKSAAGQFEVPKKYYSKVLSRFDNSVIDETPLLTMPEIVSLKIWTKDENCRRICVYGGAQLPITFSLHGVRCRVDKPPLDYTDESFLFLDLLLESRDASSER